MSIDKNNKKIATLTLGCKVNQYETDGMQQLLEEAGYEIVDFKDGADIYIVNTCSVTNMADRKSRQMLHKAKKNNENAVIVAVGCYVQAAKEELLKDPYVDIVVGNNKKKDIAHILSQYFESNGMDNGGEDQVIDISTTKEFEDLSIEKVSEHTRAYIKVQDGCNQFCSYCIIPYTRGRARSRVKEDIMKEVTALVSHGYKEVVLTGIHLSSYGIDLLNTSLIDLIESIAKIDGLLRIRLGSLEPRIITDEFAGRIAAINKLCPHFHLSLQSGCDSTLKRMNRHYTTSEYKEKCDLLRRYFDKPALTTDIIVGFPGETKEEALITLDYLKEIQLYELHVFKYSKRKGTKACDMPDQVDETIKTKRSAAVIALGKEQQIAYENQFLLNEVELLVEEIITVEDRQLYVGHSERYLKVAFESSNDVINQSVKVILESRLNDNILLGSLVRK